jgi:cytochrome c556
MRTTAPRFIALAALAALAAGCKRDCPAAPSRDELPPGGNAVQNEMRLLHAAMRDTVSAIALGELSTIPERLHAVHHARELTEQALESGAYVLPRNADQRPAFEALDHACHEQLEQLLAAATKNDPAATSAALGAVMARCDGCHAQFRVTQ